MGLIHSRAGKKRNRAEAALLCEQTAAARDERRAAQAASVEQRAEQAAGQPWWQQPTVGHAIGALIRR